MPRGIFGWSCVELARKVHERGWRYDHAEGGHRVYVNPDTPRKVFIPWHKHRPVSSGVAKQVLTIIGLFEGNE